MTPGTVAQQALDLAREAKSEIAAHEDVCAERYSNINTSIAGVNKTVDEIKSIMKWFGGGMFTVLLTVLGWLVIQQWNANSAAIAAANAKIEALQQRPTR